jgi:hypothetical protein
MERLRLWRQASIDDLNGRGVPTALSAAYPSPRFRSHSLLRISAPPAEGGVAPALSPTARGQGTAWFGAGDHAGRQTTYLNVSSLRRPHGSHRATHRSADTLRVCAAGSISRPCQLCAPGHFREGLTFGVDVLVGDSLVNLDSVLVESKLNVYRVSERILCRACCCHE